MGLFSKKKKHTPLAFDLEYNKEILGKQIVGISDSLVEYKDDPGSQVFVKYITKLLNMEILNLAHAKDVTDGAFSYHRGRVDALKELIDKREAFIFYDKNAKSKDRNTDHRAKVNYIRPKSTAGLSV
jgi:hypothetical protein